MSLDEASADDEEASLLRFRLSGGREGDGDRHGDGKWGEKTQGTDEAEHR